MNPARKLIVRPRSVAVFALVFVLAYWMGSGYVQKNSVSQAEEIKTAPEVTLKRVSGETLELSDYRGKWVFINFWATWCPPCIAEMPSMELFYQRYKERNMAMLAVSIDQSDKQFVIDFVEKYELTFEIFLDPSSEIAMQFGVMGIPSTFILNPKGEIVSQATGPREWMESSIIEYFDELMAEKEKKTEEL